MTSSVLLGTILQRAADALLSNLNRDQLARALFPFEDEDERRDWDFIPKYRPRGLRETHYASEYCGPTNRQNG